MEKTVRLLREFTKTPPEDIMPFIKYPRFDFIRKYAYKGAGRIGSGGHLILWDACELETINDEYCT